MPPVFCPRIERGQNPPEVLCTFENSPSGNTAASPQAVRGPDDVVRILPRLRREKREHFVVVLLNARHEVIAVQRLHRGDRPAVPWQQMDNTLRLSAVFRKALVL